MNIESKNHGDCIVIQGMTENQLKAFNNFLGNPAENEENFKNPVNGQYKVDISIDGKTFAYSVFNQTPKTASSTYTIKLQKCKDN